MQKIISPEEISEIIYSGKKITVITGAGVSAASGITPFRDEKGKYLIENGEYLLSTSCLYREPDRFYEEYKKNILKPNDGPNVTHITLAQLQKMGYIDTIITQNIDGLHGKENVIELHGNGTSFICTNPSCDGHYTQEQYQESNTCPRCGNMIRPDIVLYGEFAKGHKEAYKKLIESDYVIILGASLRVPDINSLLTAYMHHKYKQKQDYGFIIVNKSRTWLDNCASVCRDDLSEVFKKIQEYRIKKEIKEFLSLINIGNINVNITDDNHVISAGGIYIPFELNTYTNSKVEERTTRMVNDTIEISYSYADGINFIGTFVSNDLALVYKDKTITGGIYLPDGNTAFISAKIDENGDIGMLDINVYDNIFDMAAVADYDIKDTSFLLASLDRHIAYSSYKTDDRGFFKKFCYKDFDNIFDISAIANHVASYDDENIGNLISYNDADKQIETLKAKGINPSLSMQIDFNQILKERHHSDLKNYMTLIHIFKDIIIGKIIDAMQNEKAKIKSSGK